MATAYQVGSYVLVNGVVDQVKKVQTKGYKLTHHKVETYPQSALRELPNAGHTYGALEVESMVRVVGAALKVVTVKSDGSRGPIFEGQGWFDYLATLEVKPSGLVPEGDWWEQEGGF